MTNTSEVPAVDEGAMTRRKRPTPKRGQPKRRPATRARRFVWRANILLTQEQYVKLHEIARDEGRDFPNVIRRMIDLGIAQRK